VVTPAPAFTPSDRKAGYRYQISILEAEFSLTQVLEGSAVGRLFFEEVIGENLDIGRPSQVQLIFGRRINTRTPGRFRTRVITEGVIPSLHADYKSFTHQTVLEAIEAEQRCGIAYRDNHKTIPATLVSASV
jgi:hypothetical protein